jgi:hypothetical protein
MTTNRKFENAALLRSRVALLAALVIHLALIGFLVFRNGNTLTFTKKSKAPASQAELKPRV